MAANEPKIEDPCFKYTCAYQRCLGRLYSEERCAVQFRRVLNCCRLNPGSSKVCTGFKRQIAELEEELRKEGLDPNDPSTMSLD